MKPALLLLILLLPAALAIDEVGVNSQVSLGVQLLNVTSGSQAVTGATCRMLIYYPIFNATNWTSVAMSEVADGSGTYNATTPALQYVGQNRVVFNCSINSVPFVTSESLNVLSVLTNDTLHDINASLWTKIHNVWSEASRTLTDWSGLLPSLEPMNSTIKQGFTNASQNNASTGLYLTSIYGLVQNSYSNSSSNFTRLMTEILPPSRASIIDYLSTGGGYLVDANFVDDAEYVAPTCSLSALMTLNNTLKEGFGNETLHFSQLNATILADLQSMNDTAKQGFSNVSLYNASIWNKLDVQPQQGISLKASTPPTVYTTENITVYVSSTNSTTGQVITPSWLNISIYYPNGSLYKNDTTAEARSDGTYRYSTPANTTEGVYGVVITAQYGDRTTATTSTPVRISEEGSFDFKVDAASVGIIGYGVDYRVEATPMRGASQYEAVIRCQIPEIQNSAQQWNVLLTTGSTYTSEQKEFSLPKNMEKRNYLLTCDLAYRNNGVLTVIHAQDSFTAHERGTNILEYFRVRDILLTKKGYGWAVPALAIPLLIAMIIRRRKKKEQPQEESP